LIFGVLFWAGGAIMKDSTNEDGTMSINPEDVFIAIFAIMFGASHGGTAAGFGPDMGKAGAAAERVFKIIECPSTIDAIAINSETNKIRIDPSKVEGRIEFKDVWFRYPTRKEDFVLRGLNITVNPNESVALVGESGCGKSTFVNLLMRFYDPDHGQILLDGKDIKDINLHDLRNAISLVMQEPIIFNYSILENILYGKSDAKNSEVYEATTIANANEFIEKGDFVALDDSAQGLVSAMKENEVRIVEMIGKEKYDEECEILNKFVEFEKGNGAFQYVEGAVDTRPDNLKDMELSKGFKTQCGIKGGKLSGGQK